jgi:dTDP-glucose pyrophosphorylase
MRIIIDIDGTISELRKPGQAYKDLSPNPGAAEKISALKKAGHYIILQTARHMKTCNGDKELVVKKIGKETEDWLKKHGIAYDELHFGKPYGDAYIDDLAHPFTAWDKIKPDQFDADMLNILIPMAGRGSRFKKAGFTEPKPLIDVLGEPMVEWALKSFDFLKKVKSYRLIFVILREHDEKHGLAKKLKTVRKGANVEVIAIDQVTRGQAETALAARHIIDNNNRLFIYNCDTYSTSDIWNIIEAEDPDGIMACFRATDPRYSFAKIDASGHVTETAEKKAISGLASNGMYYFKRGSDFVRAADRMIRENALAGGEFYVAPLYNELLKSGKKIRVAIADKNHVIGTPEELAAFVASYKKPKKP